MATLLYRLGRFSFRRRRLTLAIWVTVLALFGLGAATLSGPTSGAFSIPGTESSRAMDVITEKFGGSGDGTASVKVVFTVTGDATLTGTPQKAAVEATIAELAKAPQVASVAGPYESKTISQDLRTGYATVTYTEAAADVTDEAREALLDTGAAARAAGIGVEFSGEASKLAEGGHSSETLGIAVAALVLLLTFGSLVAAGLPLLTALIGVGIGMLGIQIATGFFDLSAATPALATMLGLAVGIDYALFVVSRYRGELAVGRDPEEAAGRAVGTAGSAVVFAGLTVVIALAALAVTGIPFLTAMGIAAAGTVAVAVLVTLTLVPAILGFAGRRVIAKRLRDGGQHADRTPRMPFGERWARIVVKHRWAALLVSAAVLAVVALPATDLRLALPDDGSAAVTSTQRRAYDQLAEGFGAGFNGPLVVVVESDDAATAAAQVQKTLAGMDDVAMVLPATVDKAGGTAMLTVLPESAPTSEATQDLVQAIRDLPESAGTRVSVTGSTAVNIDISAKLSGALIPYLIIVVGLALVLLMLVFRSILVPLKATAGFLLSVAAAFGALVAVFQNGHLADLIGLDTTGPIVSVMPIFLVGILFGLAMDYEVFLVTRTREDFVHGAAPDEAIISGMRHGGRVVTAAALIMISVFAGFIMADDAIIKSLGFALAVGVAVDAFIVRMTIVPAVLSLMGRAAWWLPAGLQRILPNVDVEGAALARHLATTERELATASA
ncbi:membrane protein [Actinoplanes lobatus]|uniref:Membrane protein n=1 Tax=Actinoplanes lobatus TaxID=113568 RepID=A0A7W7MJ52_9ACTN|nr:MMPL family transporter [Actinoplanes lobatus]MBB4751680.1 RND superfamily putative drug exporter [Actinoplanes lobatus]GGN65258.1 membrane protein [Actinoplanes lobatus]GIE43263.1 membrane protein [Actinoplanes lobatus]